MLLVTLLALGLLALPLALDIQRHGSDNILKRTGEDILRLPAINSLLQALHARERFEFARNTFGQVVTSVLSLVALVALLWLLWKVLWAIIGWFG